MLSRLSVAQKGALILVVVPVLLELIFVGALAALLRNEAQQLAEIEHSKKTLLEVQHVFTTANSMAPIFCSTTITAPEKAEKIKQMLPFFENKNAVGAVSLETSPELAELMDRVSEIRQFMVPQLKRAQIAFGTSAAAVERLNASLKSPEMLTFLLEQQETSRRILAIEDRIVAEEPRQLKAFEDEFLMTVLIGTSATLMALFALLQLFTKNILKRLNAISAKAKLIAARKPLPVADQSNDEIGVLDRVIYDAGVMLEDARLRESAMFDGGAHVMCSLDSKLRIQTIGESCRRAWQFDPDQLRGKSLLSLIVPSRVDEVRHQFEQVSDNEPEAKVDTIMRCGDGTLRNLLWNVNWRNKTFYCVVEDVTELRGVEQLRQHFFSMASHDLRSPLTAIGLNVQMVSNGAKGPVTPGVQHELEKIEANLSQVMSLVNEILALEKLEAGKSTLTLSAVNAADVCESVKESLADLAAENNVTITGPRESTLLYADESKIEEAVTNLLSGVIKLSQPGAQIEISVTEKASTGFIEVYQDSYEIPPHEADLIFDKLRQSRIESDRPVKRVGLGFALVKAIAELHGGSVGVDSSSRRRNAEGTANGGTAVWMGIPLLDEEASK